MGHSITHRDNLVAEAVDIAGATAFQVSGGQLHSDFPADIVISLGGSNETASAVFNSFNNNIPNSCFRLGRS